MQAARENYLGISLMAFAMLVIPISDGIVKILSEDYAILFLNWIRFLIGGMIFIPLTLILYKGHKLQRHEMASLSLRTVLHVLAISLYFLAISTVPLADALGAYFVAPIVAIIFAAILLGERVSLIQLSSVMLGFIGAMIVVRPGPTMDIGMVYAVLSGVVFGLFLVLTRKAGKTVPPIITLGFQCGIGSLLLLPIAIYVWSPIRSADIALMVAAGVIWAIGHFAIIQAFKRSLATVLAPFVYVEILGGVSVGYLFFRDIPSSMTVAGILIVVAAGLLARYRGIEPATKN